MKRNTEKTILFTILTFFIMLLILFTTWNVLSEDMKSRYDINNYNCRHMTDDCKALFNSIGIKTTIMRGCRYNETTGRTEVAHRWLMVNTIFGDWEFECTDLTFRKVSDYFDEVTVIR